MKVRVLFLSALLFCIGFVQTSAKSFEIPRIDVEVTINADGTICITEKLTYDFDGSFSWADYKLPRKGFSSISDIRVSEGKKTYTNENSEKPGTFSIAENEDSIRIKWHYNAEDEQRTFTISYTLQGALTAGPKWSQFYWNFLSNDREKSTNTLDIRINLPGSVDVDSLHGWTQSPLGRMELQKDQGKFIVSDTNIDDDDFAKVRAVFPISILANPKITNSDFSLNEITKQEQAYEQRMAKLKERKQYWQNIGPKIFYAIIVLAVIIFYFLYQKYGKRHSTSHLSDTETIMIPGREPPALIGWLLSGRYIKSIHLISTVLDLARRGYFKIQEEEPEEGMFEDNNPTYSVQRTDQALQSNLLDWEKDVIVFVERRLAKDTHKLHEIFKSSDSNVSNWFSNWKSKLKKYCFSQEWIDLKSYTGAYWNASIQGVLFLITLGLLFYIGRDYAFDFAPSFWLSWFAALLFTMLSAVFSLAIIRPTEKGEEIKHRWNNYKEGLENAKEHSISTDKLDKHFIYALAFGLGEDELENIFTSNTDTVPSYAWIAFAAHHPSSVAAVASSFSTLGATGAASAPGTSGGAGASASAAGGGAAASAG